MNSVLDIASLHINSPAKVAYAIMGQPHWLMRLQQAVRFRLEYEAQLAETKAECENLQEAVSENNEEVDHLRLLRLTMMRRDTALLLETATQIESQIMDQAIAHYPELEHASYEDVQREFSDAAFESLCAQAYVKDVTARALGVSEGVAEMLLQLSPDQREAVLRHGSDRLQEMGIFAAIEKESTEELMAGNNNEH